MKKIKSFINISGSHEAALLTRKLHSYTYSKTRDMQIGNKT